jgi:DNA-binding NarL/FixJ family response regulator
MVEQSHLTQQQPHSIRERFTALIADDEPLARERIRRYLSAYPEFEIVAEAKSGDEALRMIEENDIERVRIAPM